MTPRLAYRVLPATPEERTRLIRAALDDGRRAEKRLLRLLAYETELGRQLEHDATLPDGDAARLDPPTLVAMRDQLRDLFQCADALATNLPVPEEAQ